MGVNVDVTGFDFRTARDDYFGETFGQAFFDDFTFLL